MQPRCLSELPDVLTAGEVAQVLRIGRNTVYEYLRTGRIPSVKIGRRLLIPKAALLRLLEDVTLPLGPEVLSRDGQGSSAALAPPARQAPFG